ncbi:DUF488 domain-containing protein [Candidatus Peregrinibacteria bacterium]|nr:DUF488 domain-containing protein [Candidatus Peregrinibacteria bacterium]
MSSLHLLHRQKVLLAFLHLNNGQCSKINLMKSVFRLCQEELHENIYDFHPYKRGPFSLCMYADMRYLQSKELISQTDKHVVLKEPVTKEILSSLDARILRGLTRLIAQHKEHSDVWLVRYIYSKYPYFAINNPDCKSRYAYADPRLKKAMQTPVIFTIGYEGKTIDAFLNELLENNVNVLVDVRNNPVSMKYGFTGTKLAEYCTVRDIEYLGMPALGIPSVYRQSLETSDDYKQLFQKYRKEVLPHADNSMEKLQRLLEQKKRIALLCFEKDIECCHRHDASEYLQQFCSNRYDLCHL